MIENLSPMIDLPRHPPMMSMADLTFHAWGPVGPVIFFRLASDNDRGTNLDQVSDAQGRR